MRVHSQELHFDTHAELECRDITGAVQHALAESGLADGILTVFAAGSTGGVVTVEAESGLLQDLLRLAEELAPRGRDYAHDARWHDGNGHSHVRATLFGAGVTVPFTGGELRLGTWQQIVFIEFDVRPRRRTVIVQCVGA